MPEEMSEYDSFNEQSKLIDTALKYTNGDMEKAKQMVSGVYSDVEVVKGKYAIPRMSIYGIFYFFLNIPNRYVMNINVLISNNDIHSQANIFENWKTFYIDFGEFTRKEFQYAIDSSDFTNHLWDSMEGYNVYAEIDEENLEKLTVIINEIICKFYQVANIEIQLALEKISSLALELEGIPVEYHRKEPAKEIDIIDSEEDRRITEIENQADHIVDARVIVSPLKGKFINDIKISEKIKIVLTLKDNKTLDIARKLNAVAEDGELLPINARIKEMIPLEKGGFIIYGLIAKNVLVRIVEEENIKIEMDTPQASSMRLKENKEQKQDSTSSDSRMIIYLVLVIGILLIFFIGFFFLL